ncbi:MAG TPA: hypothetical protein VHE53_03160 [Patescibacteria group bacterium]|nr:hypothetical protein [Patescibacteria group bacterium]
MTVEHVDGSNPFRPTIPRPEVPIPELSTLPEVYRGVTTFREILGDELPADDPQGYFRSPLKFTVQEIPGGGYIYKIVPEIFIRGVDILRLFELRGKLKTPFVTREGEEYFNDWDAMEAAEDDVRMAGNQEFVRSPDKEQLEHHRFLGEYWDEYLESENAHIQGAMGEGSNSEYNAAFDEIRKNLVTKRSLLREFSRFMFDFDIHTTDASKQESIAEKLSKNNQDPSSLIRYVASKYDSNVLSVEDLEVFLKSRSNIRDFLDRLPDKDKKTLMEWALPGQLIVIDPNLVRRREETEMDTSYCETYGFSMFNESNIYLSLGCGAINFVYEDSSAEYRLEGDNFVEVSREIGNTRPFIRPTLRWANVGGRRYYLSNPADPEGDEHYISGMVLAANTNQEFIDGLPDRRGLHGLENRQFMLEAQAPVHVSLARNKLMQIPLFAKAEQLAGF